MTEEGLYCPSGNFHIDPKRAVENAVLTHAHSDHARRGSKQYYCVDQSEALLRVRLGKKINITSVPYRETLYFNDVAVSFHPAGHILGSAQIRIQFPNQVWVVSGDFKRAADPTCDAFEPLICDVFISEATFGSPRFVWDKQTETARAIYDWWQKNRAMNYNSVLYAYSLGKAQRVLGELAKHTEELIYCHPATEKLNACYREWNINLGNTRCLSTVETTLEGQLLIVPQGFMKNEMSSCLGQRYKTAFASGWMVNQSDYHYQKGFVMSDHADWNDLLTTILETRATRIYVQHRGHGALVRKLRSLGLKAYSDQALFPKNPLQLSMF